MTVKTKIKPAIWMVLLVVFAGGAVGIWRWKYSGTSDAAGPHSAPEFQLPDATGKIHRLSDFRGEAVIVHFWASWCPPCLEELPELMAFAKRMQNKRIRIVAISVDQNWADALKVLKPEETPSDVTVLLDASGELPASYGTYQFPESYLLNRNLKILAKWVGPQNWGADETRGEIARALKD